MMFAVLYSVFFSTIWFILVQGQKDQYIIPFEQVDINLSMSDKWPKQLVMYDEDSRSALVIDATTQRIAFDSVNYQNIVMDMQNGKMYRTSNEPNLTKPEFEKLILEYNITFDLHKEPFKQCYRECETQIKLHLVGIWDGLNKMIKDEIGVFSIRLKKVLGPILMGLKSFGDLFLVGKPELKLYELGVKGLLIIFQWLGKLFDKIPGGVEPLIKSGFKFSLLDVIEAPNGAQALHAVLKPLAEKFNLMTILKDELTVPESLVQIVTGLGSMVVSGVNGIHLIISNMLQFNTTDMHKKITCLTYMVLDFSDEIQPTKKDVEDSCELLLQISKEQKEKYGNSEELERFEQIIHTLKGDVTKPIAEGVVSNAVNILTAKNQTTKDVVMKLLNELSPIAEMKLTIPILMAVLVKSLSTAEGTYYLRGLFPNIEVSQRHGDADAEERALRRLSAPRLLKRMPLVKEIYHELDEVARMYTNVTLDSLMEDQPVADFIEFTTTGIQED